MKKTLLFLFVISSLLNSCKKDSVSTYSEMIVGKWQLKSATPEGQYNPCDFEGFNNFNPDNTYNVFDACSNASSQGKWIIKDHVLTIIDDIIPIPSDLTIISLTKSNMKLEFMGSVAYYIKL